MVLLEIMLQAPLGRGGSRLLTRVTPINTTTHRQQQQVEVSRAQTWAGGFYPIRGDLYLDHPPNLRERLTSKRRIHGTYHDDSNTNRSSTNTGTTDNTIKVRSRALISQSIHQSDEHHSNILVYFSVPLPHSAPVALSHSASSGDPDPDDTPNNTVLWKGA